MRPSLLLAPVFAAVVLGGPIEKREETQLVERGADADSGADAATVGLPVVPTGGPTQAPSSAPTPLSSSVSIPSPVIGNADSTSVPDPVVNAKQPVATRYAQAAVQRHNIHRANHGAPNVEWDAKLAAAALKSAKRCTFAHFMNENGLAYGQNLALGNPAQDIAGIITDQWYSEVSEYANNYGQAQPNYGTNMENFEKWGHFTQVVWKSSSKIGCATWRCKSVASSATDSTPMPAAYGGDVTYCNYQTPGNYGGEYAANVGRPKSNKTVPTEYNVNESAIAKSYKKKTGQKWVGSS